MQGRLRKLGPACKESSGGSQEGVPYLNNPWVDHGGRAAHIQAIQGWIRGVVDMYKYPGVDHRGGARTQITQGWITGVGWACKSCRGGSRGWGAHEVQKDQYSG